MTPSPCHAVGEAARLHMRATQTTPATAIPAPTPPNTAPRSTDRSAAPSLPSAHAEAKTNTHALATPARARSTSHAGKLGVSPMPSVTRPIATSPPRMAIVVRTRRLTADIAPSRYPT